MIFSEEAFYKLIQSDTVTRFRDIAREQAMLQAAQLHNTPAKLQREADTQITLKTDLTSLIPPK